MTPPTLQEIAGITMLAIVTTALLVLPSAGKSHATVKPVDATGMSLSALTIDGIQSIPPLSEQAYGTRP
jgi:hypothetical protein